MAKITLFFFLKFNFLVNIKTVLVSSLLVATIKYHRLLGLAKSRCLLFIVLRTETPDQCTSRFCGSWSPGLEQCPLAVSLHGSRDEAALWGLFAEGTGLTHEDSTLWT